MSARRLAFFDALPPYLGGKRKLVAGIFKHLPGPDDAPVVADAFLGGGSVSLYAKARGYRVHCNDMALRSVIVGRALVANDHAKIDREDVVRLFALQAGNRGFAEKHMCPDVVTTRHARFLDNAMAVAMSVSEPKQSLLKLLLTRYIYGQRPMSNFGGRSVVHQTEAGDFDAMNPSFLRQMAQRGIVDHPSTLCDRLRASINRGVFAGAGPCTVSQSDAAAFLRSVKADIAVLDPPYPGTVDYGKALRPLDEFLECRLIEPGSNPFSGAAWGTAVDDLLDAAGHVPTWAITFGNAGGKGASLDELMAIVRRHRPIQVARSTAYAHIAAISSAESRAANRELLIVASTKHAGKD